MRIYLLADRGKQMWFLNSLQNIFLKFNADKFHAKKKKFENQSKSKGCTNFLPTKNAASQKNAVGRKLLLVWACDVRE